jgi:hypothetical protein
MTALQRGELPLTYTGGRHRARAGRAGAPATEFGWPPGPLAPLYVWQTTGGLPHVLTLGDGRFVEAASWPEPLGARLPVDTLAATASSLDDLLALVPEGCGIQIDGATQSARAVRASTVADLRRRDAPSLEQDDVELLSVPQHLAGEVARLSDRLAEHGVKHAFVVLARSRPDEHGEVTEGLWVAVFKKRTPLDQLDAIWATIVEADLWPPVRLVVGNDIRPMKADAFFTAGTRVGTPREGAVVRPLNWRESWLVTLGIVLGALPYTISSTMKDPLPAGRLLTWTTVIAEGLLLIFVLRWALGRRADGQSISKGRPKVSIGTRVGAALFGAAALWGLLGHHF